MGKPQVTGGEYRTQRHQSGHRDPSTSPDFALAQARYWGRFKDFGEVEPFELVDGGVGPDEVQDSGEARPAALDTATLASLEDFGVTVDEAEKEARDFGTTVDEAEEEDFGTTVDEAGGAVEPEVEVAAEPEPESEVAAEPEPDSEVAEASEADAGTPWESAPEPESVWKSAPEPAEEAEE